MADFIDGFEPGFEPGSAPDSAPDAGRESEQQEGCHFCGGNLLTSVFDTTFREGTTDERLFFAIPGALCIPCRQLYVDRQLIGILGLGGAQCTFAIQSDRVLRAGAA